MDPFYMGFIKANCANVKILDDRTITVTIDYEDGTQNVLNYYQEDTMYEYFYTLLTGMNKVITSNDKSTYGGI